MTLPIGLINSYFLATGPVPVTTWDGTLIANLSGSNVVGGAVAPTATTLVYVSGVPPVINAALGNEFILTVTDNVVVAFAAPTGPVGVGQQITLTLRNTSGGGLGGTTFNAIFKMSAWTDPADTKSRSITWEWNGTNWVQVSQTGVDVPN